VGLRVVPSIKDHPIRRLMLGGIRCTVSTDDPLCFANSITEEYEALVNELTFTRAELAQVARNGWEVADVATETRNTMLAEIEKLVASSA
jgi:adenine deaminase